MSSSSEIVRYSNTTLAAGAIHQDLVVSGKDELKKVYNALKPGTEAVIKFFVSTDLQGNNGKFYHAAAVHLAVNANKKMTVTATVGAYASGSYTEELQESDSEVPALANGTSTDIVESEKDIVVYRHPIIDNSQIEEIRRSNAPTRCPEAMVVVSAIKNIFKRGIALPSDQRFHYCAFTVGVKIANSMVYQEISALRGIRGTHDRRGVSSNWSSIGVTENGQLSDFDKLKDEANGDRPSHLPEDAVTINTITGIAGLKLTGPQKNKSIQGSD